MRLPLFILVFFFSSILTAQTTVSFDQIVKIKYLPYSLTITTHIPRTIIGRQEVIDVKFSIPPDKFFKKNESFYVQHFTKSLMGQDELKVTSIMALSRNDLYTAKKSNKQPEKEPDLSPYLKKELHLQINAKPIRDVALKLKGEDEESTVRNIFNFVVDHLEYYRHKIQERSARKALKQGKGDCTEYSELMIALCRANKIPARYVNGFIARTLPNARHNWVEVYFSKYGWVAFDPTFADGPLSYTTFDKMDNIYIYANNTRSDLTSGTRFSGRNSSRSNIEYQYKATHWLEKFIYKIENRFNKKKYREAGILIDSLLRNNINDYRLYKYKAKIHLDNNQLDLVLPELQGALKYSYFEQDQRYIYYYYFIYHMRKGDIEKAYKFFEKSLNMGYILSTKELTSLMEDEIYAPLKTEEKYSTLLQPLKERYSKQSKKTYYDYLPNWGYDLSMFKSDCSQPVDSPLPQSLEALSKESILQNKVKKIRITRDMGEHKAFEEYTFSSEGKQIYSKTNHGHKIRQDSINYDENGRKINSSYFNLNEFQDTSLYNKYFFTYQDNCIVKISHCDHNCPAETAKLALLIDRSQPNTTNVIVFDNFTEEKTERIYAFTEDNKPLSCLIIDGQDSTKIHWVYNKENNTSIKYIDGEQRVVSKMHSSGKPLEMTSDDSSMKFFYNRKNQLIKKWGSYKFNVKSHEFEVKFKYYKNGLLKSTQAKYPDIKNYSVKHLYDYEFYD